MSLCVTECRSVMVCVRKMHRVGFEPTRFATVVLETTPLDHSGTDAFLFLVWRVQLVWSRAQGKAEECLRSEGEAR